MTPCICCETWICCERRTAIPNAPHCLTRQKNDLHGRPAALVGKISFAIFLKADELRTAIRQFVYKNIDSGIQPLPFQHGAPLNFGDKRASLVQNAHSTRLPFSPEMARSNRLFVLFTNLLAAYHAVRACPPPRSPAQAGYTSLQSISSLTLCTTGDSVRLSS